MGVCPPPGAWYYAASNRTGTYMASCSESDRTRAFARIAVLTAVAGLCGCGGSPSGQDAPPGAWSVRAVVAPVRREAVEDRLSLVGSLAARDAVDVASEADGRIETILFDEGQPVTNGQVLIRLDSDKAGAKVEQAQARFRLSETDFGRGRDLLESETISQQEYDRLEAAFIEARASLVLSEEDLEDVTVVAPFDGVVGKRHVSPGQFITRGMALTSVVRMDPLDAEFNVPERYLGRLEVGQRIEISTVAYPDRAFPGRVTFLAPQVNLSTRTIAVEAEIANDHGLLRPGMYGKLDLILRVQEQALVIPEAAILIQGDRATVVVMNDEDVAEFRPVTVGIRLPSRAVIDAGLVEGERVVVEGHQKLGPGVPIQISPASAAYGISVPAPTPDAAP